MPPKKSGLGRHTKKVRAKKTLRQQDEVFAEDNRRKTKARMAKNRQQEVVKERATALRQARRNVRGAKEKKQQRERLAYQQSKKKLEELEDDTIRAYQEAAYNRNSYKDFCARTDRNSDEFWTLRGSLSTFLSFVAYRLGYGWTDQAETWWDGRGHGRERPREGIFWIR